MENSCNYDPPGKILEFRPSWTYLKKGKVDHAPPERRWGAHLPLIAFEYVGGMWINH